MQLRGIGAHYTLPVTRSCPRLFLRWHSGQPDSIGYKIKLTGSPSLGQISRCITTVHRYTNSGEITCTLDTVWKVGAGTKGPDAAWWGPGERRSGPAAFLQPPPQGCLHARALSLFRPHRHSLSFSPVLLALPNTFLDKKDKSPTRYLVWQSSTVGTLGGKERQFLRNAASYLFWAFPK